MRFLPHRVGAVVVGGLMFGLIGRENQVLHGVGEKTGKSRQQRYPTRRLFRLYIAREKRRLGGLTRMKRRKRRGPPNRTLRFGIALCLWNILLPPPALWKPPRL